jgi:hypothetical protein
MKRKDYLEELGFVHPEKKTMELLKENLHNLNYKQYTIEISKRRYIVGIFCDYFIYYVESLVQREGWWDMYPHELPKAKPVEIKDLVLNISFSFLLTKEEIKKDEDKIKQYLTDLGWQISIILLEHERLNLESMKMQYMVIGDNYYEVYACTDGETYLVTTVRYVEPDNIDEEEFKANMLEGVEEVIDKKIMKLQARKKIIK